MPVADHTLKAKIKGSLEHTYFGNPEDAVSVSDSDEPGDSIHVIIVSPKFQGMRLAEKTDLILSQLYQTLSPDDWGRITLSIGVSPDELKAI
jgi:stress-induced morphogen